MKTEITTPKAAKMVIRIQDAISVADLSQRVGVKAGEIIKKLDGSRYYEHGKSAYRF